MFQGASGITQTGTVVDSAPLAPLPESRAGKELKSVQALRAIAALSVVMYHIDFIHKGGYGVDIFFVISGFIVAYVCASNTDNFLLKRVIRIAPLYWVGTLGVFLIAVVAPYELNSPNLNAIDLVKSMLFIPFRRDTGSVSPVLFLGWSLELEVYFYVIYALALKLYRKGAMVVSSAILVAAAIVGSQIPESAAIVKFCTHPVIVEFAFGIGVYAFWLRFRPWLGRIPVVVGIVGSLLSYVWILSQTDLATKGNRLTIIGLPSVAMLLCFLSLEGRVPFPKWILSVGNASFSLYLFHPYVLQLVDKKIVSFSRFTIEALAAAVISIVICVLLAIASFKIVERPSNTFLRRHLIKARTV